MRARSLLLLLPPCLALLSAPSANAAVPDPLRSQVDPCLVVCPAGDFTFHVVVRDVANVPIAGATVVVNLCNCPSVHLCSGPCDVLATSDAAGNAFFQIKGGGICPGGVASVTADGVLLASRTVASPDQDGDLSVTSADIAIISGKLLLPYDPGADLDCDGTVSNADVSIASSHSSHNCQGVVPTEGQSWGKVKAIYR
jgi:hypothetical protein